MRVADARLALGGTRFVDLRWHDEVDSTNRRLLELAVSGAPEGVVVAADHQTAGRGRRGRSWEASPGSSLLVSALLRPDLPADRAYLVVIAAGLAAAEACREVAGVDVGLKWPNDLVVPAAGPAGGGGPEIGGGGGDERKLGGLLGEVLAPDRGGGARAIVVGLGLNVEWPGPLPAELAGMAVTLAEVAGRPLDRTDLLVAYLLHLGERYRSLLGSGPHETVNRFRDRCVTLGRPVRVDLETTSFTGQAIEIAATGDLVVDVAGERRLVSAGDVVHLRE